MTIEYWCGQFNIVDGGVQEDGPLVGIFEGARSAAGVSVYAVAEPVGSASAHLCDQVIELIADSFGDPQDALTTNLTRALGVAHDHVREWNRTHGIQRLGGIGLSCLVARGDEAYLAQCGPALALAHTGGRFRLAAPAGDESLRPLGMGERAAPVFTRFTVAPGDVLLLTYSAADRLIDRGTLMSLVSAPPDEALPALYLRVRDAPCFGALYLAAQEAPEPAYLPPAGATRTAQAGGAPTATRVQPPPGRPRNRDLNDARRNGHHGPLSEPTRPSAPAHRAGPRSYRSLGVLGDGTHLPLGRLAAIAGGFAALVLLLWLVVPALTRRGNDDRYASLLRSADQQITAAQSASDAAHKRDLYKRAESDLLDAKTIRPDTTEVSDRLDRISAALAELDGTRELPEPTQLADLGASGVTSQSAIQIAVGDRVYVLDTAGGKVLAFSGAKDERPETVFEEGKTIGADRAGRARHVTVAPDSGGRTSRVLVLDSNRKLFALGSNGAWRAVPLTGADTWKSDTAIAATASALYVLDAAGEQVWRHTGTTEAYDAPPEPLVTRAALKSGIAISIIGIPMIATSDNRVLRIVDGHDEELKPAALDRRLMAPTAPTFNPSDSLLYLADRGNQRIVLLDAAGGFQGQIVSRRFTNFRAFALDEIRGVIYAVCGQSLLTAPLPH